MKWAGFLRRTLGGRLGPAALTAALALRLPAASPWPEVQSDLPPDPNVRWGELPNGLRYAILANAEPKNRISLRLLVATGSLYERDDEQGEAHFVEHMLFRGTKSHRGDTLNQLLQRAGIGYGPDSNAFTGYKSTVYHLELPDTREATLRLGLETFREYATEALIERRDVNTERGVILNEAASRLTPEYLVQLMNLDFLWPDSLVVRRVPIGQNQVIRNCTRDQLARFYDAWYRPERLVLVVVGDMDPALVEPIARETLGSLRGHGSTGTPPPPFAPDRASGSNVSLVGDARLPGVAFTLEHPVPWPRAPDTHAHRAEFLHLALGMSMLQSRLEKFAHQNEPTFVAPVASVTNPVVDWLVVSLSANSDLPHWNRALTDLEKEHRRVFLYGFTAEELRIAKAAYAAAYAQAVRSAASRSSQALADQLADSILNGYVFPTPAAQAADATPAIEATTPAECLTAFRAAWTSAAPHVFVAANNLFLGNRNEVADVLNNSRLTKVARPPSEAPPAFAYTDFGPPGRIVREEPVPDLDLRLATFANGVRLNFKATTFESDLVAVYVMVGNGKLSQPVSEPGLDLLADQVVMGGGLGRHTAQQINDVLAGRSLSVSFGVTTDACVFSARCSRNDLKLCLELINAYLTDAAYRPDTLTAARAAFGSMYESLAASPGGPITQYASQIMAGNDPRFGIPNPERLGARNLSELTQWLEPQFKHGPIELAIVGDTTWEEASSAAAGTLGALPERQLRMDSPASGAPPAPAQTPQERTHHYVTALTLQQCAIAWLWPMPDWTDFHKERRYALLANAITERLRARIREDLGAAYSPSASLVEYEGFPNFGYLLAYVEVPPKRATEVMRAVDKEISRLRSRSLSDAEFRQIKEPLVRAREEDVRTNDYWAVTVLRDAQQHPERLAAARDRQADFTSISSQDLRALAKQCLDVDRCVLLTAEPGVVIKIQRK